MQDLYFDIKDRLSSPATATMTHTCSMALEITGNNVFRSDFVEQEESSILETQKRVSSEWTNEKHSLYLKSIEASFVDQLYNSLEMQSCQTQKTSSSDASGQFKALHGGCWSNKKFRRENPQVKDSKRAHLSQTNPWIQHFTKQEKPLSTTISLQYPVPESQIHEEPGCSNTEVSDQNFVEDTTVKRANMKKRTRTSRVSNSNNDQVVPFCTSPKE